MTSSCNFKVFYVVTSKLLEDKEGCAYLLFKSGFFSCLKYSCIVSILLARKDTLLLDCNIYLFALGL